MEAAADHTKDFKEVQKVQVTLEEEVVKKRDEVEKLQKIVEQKVNQTQVLVQVRRVVIL